MLLHISDIFENIDLVGKNIASMLSYDASAPMLFSSGLFWLLFIIFLPVYSLLKSSKWKMSIFVVGFSL